VQISSRQIIAFLITAPLAGSAVFLSRPFFSDDNKISDIFGAELYNIEIGKTAHQKFFKSNNLDELKDNFLSKLPVYYHLFPGLALRKAMKDDYWKGDTMIVKGWVLARSLILLSVIAYLEGNHVR